MQVGAGTRLGPYELVAPVGAGGMGEVWRATDTRLDRSVAIKILPAEFAGNAQLRLRFEREAKTISQLNHPNICALFDVGENYLVMELLEGETLADRIARSALPISETLKIGAQIADALDRAHRAGIIHRDLKPGNVMLTKSGAKLLDFGLAKSNASPLTSLSGATEHKPLTQEGTILGTFQYMAPEQLEGLEADARTDIFAFGAVLYEMATARRAFQGASKTSLIAAIVSAEPPPISALQPLTPPAFEHVVRKCLAKDPDARWQSAHDVAEELRWIGEAGSSAGVAAPLIRRRKRVEWLGWAVAVAVAIAGAAAIRFRPAPAAPRVESAIVAPDGVSFSYADGSIALSRDGQQLAFVARAAGGVPTLWVRSMSASAARQLADTEAAHAIFWSPDGKYIGFAARGKLKKIGIAGGAPETLAEVNGVSAGAWLPNGDILYASLLGIMRVSAAGGTPVVVAKGTTRTLTSPVPLPDGRHFLFTAFRGQEKEGVFVGSLDTHEELPLLPDVHSNTAYAPPGFILYSREGDLRAQPFDVKTLKLTGDPVRLADHVQYDPNSKAALYSVSQNGTLVYVEGEGAGRSQLTWIARDGKILGTLAPPAMFYSPRLSHDEKRVAVDWSDAETAKGDIWTFDLAHGTSSRLTYDPANESAPVWTPDDRRIMFLSEKTGTTSIFQRQAGGTGGDELVLARSVPSMPLDISPDGRWLAFESVDRSAGRPNPDIWMLDLTNHTASPFVATPFNEEGLRFSPDGKWVAFASNESGKKEIYAQQFPDSNGKILVSRNGGETPFWRNDGLELYYLSSDRKLMAVPITYTPQFDAGVPVALFDAHVRDSTAWSQIAVTKDGSKFLVNLTVGEEGTRPMTLVQNWTASLAH